MIKCIIFQYQKSNKLRINTDYYSFLYAYIENLDRDTYTFFDRIILIFSNLEN